MAKAALGFIETRGNTGNVFALDAMLKEAHVDFVDKIGIGGAYVTAVVQGAVSACLSSVSAGAAAAESAGELVCQNVIPSPHERIFDFIIGKKTKKNLTGHQALGVIETLGFATAMEAADAAIKAAHIELAEWVKVGGGKVNAVIRGDVASVQTAVQAGVSFAGRIGDVQGHTVIPQPSPKLYKFPIALKLPTEQTGEPGLPLNAIGILETHGFAPLIDGADAAVKAAKVEIIEWRQVGSGYVSFVIEGDVAAVRSALQAGSDAASKTGKVISEVVIPSPDDGMDKT